MPPQDDTSIPSSGVLPPSPAGLKPWELQC